MSSRTSNGESFGREVYRLPFAVQGAKRFVLAIFGGLTLMVGLWTMMMLQSSVLALENESRALFTGVLVFFAALIVGGFSVTWFVLSRYPQALVVRERAVVLEHGARTRAVRFDAVRGLDQRDTHGTLTYVVLIDDGSEIPFAAADGSRDAAHALVERAGLEWVQEPVRAARDACARPREHEGAAATEN